MVTFMLQSLAGAAVDVKPDVIVVPTKDTPTNNTGPTTPDRVLPGERPTRKSYLIPELEIPLFIIALNRFDLLAYDRATYGVSWRNFRTHLLHGPWVVDQDQFAVNQIGHPYQGSMYYGFARSAGLNYWESWVHSNAGSVIWELAGENTDPSINDQVASGTAGSFIGEALFRLSNLVLEEGGPEPSRWRKLAAAAISPPTELNRLVFGSRFGPVLESRHPALESRLQLGLGSNVTRDAPGSTADLARFPGYGDFELTYGLPGKPGYRYLRPFDYFNIEVNSVIENGHQYDGGMIRGLLFGTDYEVGDNYRGIWGLYGSYDYMAPQVYRLSTTAASVGTTGQWWLSRHIALQESALAGLGFGAAGTIQINGDEKDFHYGLTPEQLLSMRLLFGSRVMLDSTVRNYYVTGIGASKANGTETIQQVNTSIALRLYGHHAIALGFLLAHRDARYDTLASRRQLIQTVTLTYNWLGHPHFGAIDWRNR